MSQPSPWLTDPQATISLLKKYEFRFSKRFGQNFLIDSHVLDKIIMAAEISGQDRVLEIGPGFGALTQQLAYRAKSVVAVEVDRKLLEVLQETLEGYNNVRVICQDIMKTDIRKLTEEWPAEETAAEDTIAKETTAEQTTAEETIAEQEAIGKENISEEPQGKLKVVANLPYYITTPVIMKLYEEGPRFDSVTLMVQKEVAERICAKPGSKEYGALSLAVAYYADAKIMANVPPNCFMPRPDVASTVIRLKSIERNDAIDKELLFLLIHAAFGKRRKTLLNCLSSASGLSLSKEEISELIREAGFREDVRGEMLSLADYMRLADLMTKKAEK